MPILTDTNLAAIIHLTPHKDVVCASSHSPARDKTILSFSPRIEGFEYENTQFNLGQLGAEVAIIFDDEDCIDELIDMLQTLKQVHNALKAG
jgi:hypothetical protein